MIRTYIAAAVLLGSALSLCPAAEPAVAESAEMTITLRPGEVKTFDLESNPTTGYSWSDLTKEEPCAEVKLDYIAPEAPEGMCGVPGTCRVTVRGKKAGTQQLRLAYIRPWEPLTQEHEEKIITIIVQP